MSTQTSKAGKHGTLYLFRVVYHDPGDNGFGFATVLRWGYSEEDVRETWLDNPEGFEISSIEEVRS